MEGFTDDTQRYEIIEGELFITSMHGLAHQHVVGNVLYKLRMWDRPCRLGRAIPAPGLVLSGANAVIPDLIWISNDRLATAVNASGHLIATPELIVEVLSDLPEDRQKDYKQKLNLYSAEGVLESWIVDESRSAISLHRRKKGTLKEIGIFSMEDLLTSPLLPGFSCRAADFFLPI